MFRHADVVCLCLVCILNVVSCIVACELVLRCFECVCYM